MPKHIASFIRRTYKVITALIVAVAFFFFYNVYLVDHSLINLRAALSQAAQAQTIEDFEKLKPFIRAPIISEISGRTLPSKSILSADLMENIISSPKQIDQVEDIKMCLKQMIEEREKTRGGLVAVLNKMNSHIFAPSVKVNVKKANIWIMKIASRLGSLTDKKAIQEAYYDMGNAYVQLSDIDGAEKAFLKAIEIDPKSDMGIKSKFNLGWAYKTFGKYDLAMKTFEELAKEFPDLDIAMAGKYQIADTMFKRGDHRGARDAYAEIAERNPDYTNADMGFFQAGYISFYDLDDRDAALKYFELLKNRYPGSALARHAEDEVKKVIAYDYRRNGFELLKKGRYDDALGYFEKAVSVLPRDAGAMGGMGLAFYWLNNRKDALNSAIKASGISTSDQTAYVNSIYVYMKTGLVDEAIRMGEEILSKHKIKLPEFYYNMGCAYLAKRKVADAINMFKLAVKRSPDSVYAHNNLGCAFWLVSRYPEAIKIFQKAIALDPNYADAHFNLGISYFYMNLLENSHKEFQKAVLINENDNKSKEYMRRIEEILGYKPVG